MSHHGLVFLVGEVKVWYDRLERVENLVVFGHVCSEDTPEEWRKQQKPNNQCTVT